MSKEKSQSKKTEEKAKTEAKPDTKATKAKAAPAAPAKEPEKFGTKPENTIFIGNKPAMTYVLAVLTCFNENKAKEVKICARGRAISSAVDVAELARNRFLPDVKVKSIVTSTEQVTRREGGGEANVSAIEIVLSK